MIKRLARPAPRGRRPLDVREDSIVTDQLSMPHSPPSRPRASICSIPGAHAGQGRSKSGAQDRHRLLPGFLRGRIHNGYAIATVPCRAHGAWRARDWDELKKRDGSPGAAICVVDLRSGDLVEWSRLNGAIKELFDVAMIPIGALPEGLRINLPRHPEPDLSFDPEFGPLAPAHRSSDESQDP